MDTAAFLHFMVAMFAISNPFGNMAVFLGLIGNRSLQELRSSAIRMGFAIIVILLLMTWFGTGVLDIFGISLPIFKIAGGIIILLLGLHMLRPNYSSEAHPESELAESKTKLNIAVVPMAIPIIAGPGAITTLIIFTHHHSSVIDLSVISFGVILLSLVITIIFYFSNYIKRLLGDSGINILVRVSGLILTAIAMEMIVSGMQSVFPMLTA